MRLNIEGLARRLAVLFLAAGLFLFLKRWIPGLANLSTNMLGGFALKGNTVPGALRQVAGHFAVLALFLACLVGTGKMGRDINLIRSRSGHGLADFLIDTALGLLAVSAAWLGLGLVGLAYPAPAAIIAAGLAVRGAAGRGSVAGREILRPSLLFVALITLPPALSPETEVDSLIYHLALPQSYAAAHKIYLRPEMVESGYTQGHEMLGLESLLLGSEQCVKLLSWAAILLAGLCAAALLTGPFQPLAVPAALVVITSPGLLVLASRSKNDAMAIFLTGAILLARARTGTRWMLLAGILAGGAYSFKNAGTLAVIAVFASLLVLRRDRLRGAIAVAAGWLLVAGPWLARNWLELGNPVFPVLMNLVASPGWGPINHRMAVDFLRLWLDANPAGPGAFIYALAMTLAALSPVLVAALPFMPMLWRDRPELRWLAVFAGAYFAGWLAVLPWHGRYLFPAFVPFTVLSVAAWHVYRGSTGRLILATRTLCAATAAAGLAVGFGGLAWTGSPLANFLGIESGEGYRIRILGSYREAVQATARETLPGRKVLVIGDWRTYPLANRLITGGDAVSVPIIWDAARTCASPERLLVKLRQRRITHVLHNIPQAATAASIAARFPWKKIPLDLYRAFWYRHATLAWKTGTSLRAEGYFLLYRLEPAGTRRPFRGWLPGTEGEFNRPRRMFSKGARVEEKTIEMARLEALFGEAPELLARRLTLVASSGDFRQAGEIIRRMSRVAPEAGRIYSDWGAVSLAPGPGGRSVKALSGAYKKEENLLPMLFNIGIPYAFQTAP
jgi:hypothetical protein